MSGAATARPSTDASALVAATAAAPSGAETARASLENQQKQILALRGNYLAALEAKKSEAYLARVRVQRLERELRDTRVATASRGALEAKHNSMLEHKAWREAPKLKAGVGVAPASPDDVLALSTLFNNRLAEMYEDPALRQWFKLFRHMDDDNSGRITYSELARTVREEMQLPPRKLPDSKLRAVWAALDADGSGFITAGEFGGFMRKGEPAVPPELSWQARVLASKRAIADQVRAEAEGDRWIAAGIEPASDGQVIVLAQLINRTLEQLYEDPQKRSWFKLFKHMDDDGSGRVTFAELSAMLRDDLGLSSNELPAAALKAVWAALDADGSGFITAGEFGGFMRRGEAEGVTLTSTLWRERMMDARNADMAKWRRREGRRAARTQKRQHAEHEAMRERVRAMREYRQRAIDANAAAKARKQQEAMRDRTERDAPKLLARTSGVEPAAEAQLRAVAELLNRRLALHVEDPARRSWFKLFRHMDDDGSGRITYAELSAVIRDELRVSAREMPEAHLRAVWAAIDADQSGFATAGKFGMFMKRGGRALVEDASLTWRDKVEAARKAEADQVRAEAEGVYGVGRSLTAGVPPASEADVQVLSQLINRTLEQLYEDPQKRSWFKLFKHMDDDGSGRITYPEFAAMIRELGLTTQQLPVAALKAVWVALDDDGSGFISAGEFGNFMRRGGRLVDLTKVRPLDNRRILNQQLRQGLEEQTAKAAKQLCAELARDTKQRRDKAAKLEAELAEAREGFVELMSNASQLSATLPLPRPLTALATHRNPPAPPLAPAAAPDAAPDAAAAPSSADATMTTMTTVTPLPARPRTSQSARDRSKPLDLPSLYGPSAGVAGSSGRSSPRGSPSERRFVRPNHPTFVRPSSGVSHHGGRHAAKQHYLAQSPLYPRPTPPASPRSQSALGRHGGHGGGEPASP